MHKRNSIINIPLFIGGILSIALHGAALYSKGIYTPPKPLLETGKTVVQLTLRPSVANQSAPPEFMHADPIKPEKLTAEVRAPESIPMPKPVQESLLEPQPKVDLKKSTEQNSSLQEEKGVRLEAHPIEGIKATYPRISQRRNEEGTVVLSIEVLANGTAGNVEILESSGYQRLDEAAVKAAEKTTYSPAKRLGQNIDSILIQPLTFELTQ